MFYLPHVVREAVCLNSNTVWNEMWANSSIATSSNGIIQSTEKIRTKIPFLLPMA